jgi:hypothetical protein
MRHKLIENKNAINIVIKNNVGKAYSNRKKQTKVKNIQSSSSIPNILVPTYSNRFVDIPNPKISHNYDLNEPRIRSEAPISTTLGSESFHTIGDPTPTSVYSEPTPELEEPVPIINQDKNQNIQDENELEEYYKNLAKREEQQKINRWKQENMRIVTSPEGIKEAIYPTEEEYKTIQRNKSLLGNQLMNTLKAQKLSNEGISQKLGFDDEGYDSNASSSLKNRKPRIFIHSEDDEDISSGAETVKASPAYQSRRRRSNEEKAQDIAEKEQAKKEKNKMKLAKAQKDFEDAKTEKQREIARAKIESLKMKN